MNSRLRLTWIDGSGTDVILVYRGTTSVFSAASVVGCVLAGVQEFIDTGLAAATTYYYWLVAMNENGAAVEVGPASGTTLAYEAQDISPRAGVPDLPQDLVEYFAANVLKANGDPNFTDGFDETAPVAGAIPLYPGYMEDKPADCGLVNCEEAAPFLEMAPVKEAICRVFFRFQTDSEFSGRQRSEAAAQALYKHLRPDPGIPLTGVTLPSGRQVEIFLEARKTPAGEDQQGRYIYQVEFVARFRDIDVPL